MEHDYQIKIKRPDEAGWISIGGGGGLAIIAGPCTAESKDLCVDVAGYLDEICLDLGLNYIFKASYDKANRTSGASRRGPGFDEGLEYLQAVRTEVGCPVITDVHEPAEAPNLPFCADIIQIPALLSRQTSLLQAAAATGLPVNIKKGQFMSARDLGNAILKMPPGTDVMVTERGNSFGYNNLVVDFRNILWMREFFRPVIFDATHSSQFPSSDGAKSGGDRRLAPHLARAAVAMGVSGVFMETHPDPDNAWSDGPNSIYLSDMKRILEGLYEIDHASREAATDRDEILL